MLLGALRVLVILALDKSFRLPHCCPPIAHFIYSFSLCEDSIQHIQLEITSWSHCSSNTMKYSLAFSCKIWYERRPSIIIHLSEKGYQYCSSFSMGRNSIVFRLVCAKRRIYSTLGVQISSIATPNVTEYSSSYNFLNTRLAAVDGVFRANIGICIIIYSGYT